MLGHAVAAAQELAPERLIVVVGHGRDQVGAHATGAAPDAEVVIQEQQGGTGHAVRTVLEAVGPIAGQVIVTYGDMPLLRGATLAAPGRRARAGGQRGDRADRADRPDPTGYGRIMRDAAGAITGIVEQADATDEQRLIDEINSGLLRLRRHAAARTRSSGCPRPTRQGQEYLTDVRRASCAATVTRSATLHGRRRHRDPGRQRPGAAGPGPADVQRPAARALDAGRGDDRRSGHAPGWTWRSPSAPDVEIGAVHPAGGATTVGAGAPRSARDCVLTRHRGRRRARSVINAVCERAEIGPEATVGPYTRLRPGTRLGRGARAGSFVEMKNAVVGEGSKVPHLTYVGDADIGAGSQHRRRHGVRQLRRRGQAPHHGRRPRPDRERHDAGRAGRDRRRRVHRRRLGHHGRTSPPGESRVSAGPGSATSPGWVARRRAGTAAAARPRRPVGAARSGGPVRGAGRTARGERERDATRARERASVSGIRRPVRRS